MWPPLPCVGGGEALTSRSGENENSAAPPAMRRDGVPGVGSKGASPSNIRLRTKEGWRRQRRLRPRVGGAGRRDAAGHGGMQASAGGRDAAASYWEGEREMVLGFGVGGEVFIYHDKMTQTVGSVMDGHKHLGCAWAI